MRTAVLLAAWVVALLGAADAAADPRSHAPKPKRTITIDVETIVVYRGVAADGTMIPRPALGTTPLPTTPPPKCKKDRRGDLRCVVTS